MRLMLNTRAGGEEGDSSHSPLRDGDTAFLLGSLTRGWQPHEQAWAPPISSALGAEALLSVSLPASLSAKKSPNLGPLLAGATGLVIRGTVLCTVRQAQISFTSPLCLMIVALSSHFQDEARKAHGG